MTVCQLASYSSPDVNPIEALWKKGKRLAAHLLWLPYFTDVVTKGNATLEKLAGLPREPIALVINYRYLIPCRLTHDLLSA